VRCVIQQGTLSFARRMAHCCGDALRASSSVCAHNGQVISQPSSLARVREFQRVPESVVLHSLGGRQQADVVVSSPPSWHGTMSRLAIAASAHEQRTRATASEDHGQEGHLARTAATS
jgi:hypothetical protein